MQQKLTETLSETLRFAHDRMAYSATRNACDATAKKERGVFHFLSSLGHHESKLSRWPSLATIRFSKFASLAKKI